MKTVEGRRTLLEKLLVQSQEWQVEVKEQLRVLPHDMPEYNELVEKLDKLIGNEQMLRRQLAVL